MFLSVFCQNTTFTRKDGTTRPNHTEMTYPGQEIVYCPFCTTRLIALGECDNHIVMLYPTGELPRSEGPIYVPRVIVRKKYHLIQHLKELFFPSNQ